MTDIQGPSVVTRAKARLRALFRRPRGPGHPAGVSHGTARDFDSVEPVDWYAVVRDDFLAGQRPESSGAVAPETAPSESSPSERAGSTVFVLTGRDIPRAVGSMSAQAAPPPAAPPPAAPRDTPEPTSGPRERKPAPAASPPPATTAAAADRPEPGPPDPQPSQAGERASDPLLRTPASVKTISDDFFDGLIRRVEGDR